MTSLHVNDIVEVRITEVGREIHRNWYLSIMGGKLAKGMPYRGLKADAEGWVEFQFWEACMIFGPHFDLGHQAPFTELRRSERTKT